MSSTWSGSQIRVSHLATCHFAKAQSDVALPLSRDKGRHTEKEYLRKLNKPGLRIPRYGTLSHDVVLPQSHPPPEAEVDGYSFLRKKPFILYPKTGFIPDTLTPFSAPCVCFRSSTQQTYVGKFGLQLLNQIAWPDEGKVSCWTHRPPKLAD